jgi:hypothetical protein
MARAPKVVDTLTAIQPPLSAGPNPASMGPEPRVIQAIGRLALLADPPLGLLASRDCPGRILLGTPLLWAHRSTR